jgi:hypothetical protein
MRTLPPDAHDDPVAYSYVSDLKFAGEHIQHSGVGQQELWRRPTRGHGNDVI